MGRVQWAWWSDPRQRRAVLAELRVAAAILVAGVLLGALWAWFAPSAARSADAGESQVAADGVLALLSLGAGVLTAIVLVAIPGPRPTLRLGVVLGAATVANLLAAVVGRALGVGLPAAPGVALLWPLVTAVLTALRILVTLVVSPDGDVPSPPHGSAAPGADEDRDDEAEVSAPPVR